MQTIKNNYLALMATLFISFLLISCGGTSNSQVVDGGISGTGITMGRIMKLGDTSLQVNGISFDTDNANFQRDGLVSTGKSEFSLGEYIVVKGSVNATKVSGTADEVIFEDILEGAVTLATTDSFNIEVLGQNVKTDKQTVLHGVANLGDLMRGNIVEVSGYKDASGLIYATSIKLKEKGFIEGQSQNELKGTISNNNLPSKTFMINAILVDYSAAVLKDFNGKSPENGQFVEVKSNSPINANNVLIAKELDLKSKYTTVSANTKLEVEGVVTRFVSSKDFDVNGILVITTSETKYKKGLESDLALNVNLEVEGIVNSALVLDAKEIEFEKPEKDDSKDKNKEEDSNDDGDKSQEGDDEEESEANSSNTSGDNDPEEGGDNSEDQSNSEPEASGGSSQEDVEESDLEKDKDDDSEKD